MSMPLFLTGAAFADEAQVLDFQVHAKILQACIDEAQKAEESGRGSLAAGLLDQAASELQRLREIYPDKAPRLPSGLSDYSRRRKWTIPPITVAPQSPLQESPSPAGRGAASATPAQPEATPLNPWRPLFSTGLDSPLTDGDRTPWTFHPPGKASTTPPPADPLPIIPDVPKLGYGLQGLGEIPRVYELPPPTVLANQFATKPQSEKPFELSDQDIKGLFPRATLLDDQALGRHLKSPEELLTAVSGLTAGTAYKLSTLGNTQTILSIEKTLVAHNFPASRAAKLAPVIKDLLRSPKAKGMLLVTGAVAGAVFLYEIMTEKDESKLYILNRPEPAKETPKP